MDMDQALDELKKYAKELTNIGDANQAAKNDKDRFIHLFAKVYQYYNYIEKNAGKNMNVFMDAVDVMADIPIYNPSLQEWMDLMMGSKKQNTNNKSVTNQNEDVDLSHIRGPIESILSEIKNMQGWDQDKMGDLEWELNKYRQMLVANKDLFEPSLYNTYLDEIDAALAKIGKTNKVINNDIDDIINRM